MPKRLTTQKHKNALLIFQNDVKQLQNMFPNKWKDHKTRELAYFQLANMVDTTIILGFLFIGKLCTSLVKF